MNISHAPATSPTPLSDALAAPAQAAPERVPSRRSMDVVAHTPPPSVWRRAKTSFRDGYFYAAATATLLSAISFFRTLHVLNAGVPVAGKTALSIEDLRKGTYLSLRGTARLDAAKEITLPLAMLTLSGMCLAMRVHKHLKLRSSADGTGAV